MIVAFTDGVTLTTDAMLYRAGIMLGLDGDLVSGLPYMPRKMIPRLCGPSDSSRPSEAFVMYALVQFFRETKREH